MAVLLAAHPAPVCRLLNSAQKFERTFRDLGRAGGSLSPIERLFFSLVLANTRTPSAEAATGPRT